jgi:hypothetical protein
MTLLDARHWQVTKADSGSWDVIAKALNITKTDLFAANGLTGYRPLVVGEVLHVPFEEA